jgi:hypothetical protein
MKMSHTIKFLALVIALTSALANGLRAEAQSNSAPADYAAFSQVIADRNIFDPNRVSHASGTRRTVRRSNRTKINSAPQFSLVGTMSYEKGQFAFFSGNDADLKKILMRDGSIASYTVTDITPTQVTLQTADKKNLTLKIGDAMQQESGTWQLVSAGPAPVDSTGVSPAATAADDSAAPAAEAPANPAAGGGAASEILKRLMQKRQQENQ